MTGLSDHPLYHLWEAGRVAWPGIDLAPRLFLDRLDRHAAAAEQERPRTIPHADDLYLACACAQGDRQAATPGRGPWRQQ